MLRAWWVRRPRLRRRAEMAFSTLVGTCETLEVRTLLTAHADISEHVHPVFAPGTSEEYIQQFSDTPSTGIDAFQLNPRWSATATNGSELEQGDPTILTWSILPDGTTIHGFNGEPVSPSDLVETFRGIYDVAHDPEDTNYDGEAWFELIEGVFDRWSELTGITYVYEPNDDGAFISSGSPGILGVRGDVRIGGHYIDGNSGVLAYNFYPNTGEMVIDTADSFFTNTGGNSIRLRNVVAHEAGHGIGIRHVVSNDASFLLEPFYNGSFDGPQLDDLLAAQRHYGDALEDTGGGNDTAGTAYSLGALAADSSVTFGTGGDTTSVAPTDTDFLSIDDDSDTDYFSFALTSRSIVHVNLNPMGTTYNQGPQGGSQSPLNTQALSDLTVELIGADGSTVLVIANENGIGEGEVIEELLLEPETYYVRVTGSANDVQMYQLGVTVMPPPVAVVSNNTINGGSDNRSGINTLTLEFDTPVTIGDPSDLVLFNHTTAAAVVVAGATLSGNGTTAVTWNFNDFDLPDGQYTAELSASAATPNLAQTSAFSFGKLRGDVNGNGRVDINDLNPISANWLDEGDPFIDGDATGDGRVDINDLNPISANWTAEMEELSVDFGDAPEADTSFPTTSENNGARHVITGNTLRLGVLRDGEDDGQPGADATGDDTTTSDDEDGVVITGGGALETETSVDVEITASGDGFVNAWIDYNQDGDWDDEGEHVIVDAAVTGGVVSTFGITAPLGSQGTALARFRLTGTAGYSYAGLAPDGEVEDYQITIDNDAGPAADSLAVLLMSEPESPRLLLQAGSFAGFNMSLWPGPNRRRDVSQQPTADDESRQPARSETTFAEASRPGVPHDSDHWAPATIDRGGGTDALS